MADTDFAALGDYRQTVAEMYARLRAASGDEIDRWLGFRHQRDELFRTHSQSALSHTQRQSFDSLTYFDYRPDLRFMLPLSREVDVGTIEVDLEADGPTRMERFAKIEFEIEGRTVALSLFWILGYGGGIFLPFRDSTNGVETYGGGRYLLDTIKGADLGREGDRLVIDFNYAYNPSCAYDPRWHCPLAPRENWLPVPIRAGELSFPGVEFVEEPEGAR